MLDDATLTTGPAALSRIREILDSARSAPRVFFPGDRVPNMSIAALSVDGVIGGVAWCLGGAFCWSGLVAEMAAERTVPAPNPWTPTDPKEAA